MQKRVIEFWKKDEAEKRAKGKKEEKTSHHPELYKNPPQPGTARYARLLKRMRKIEGDLEAKNKPAEDDDNANDATKP